MAKLYIRNPRRPKARSAARGRKAVIEPAIFAKVREIALSLPGTEETTSYGTPAFKLRDGVGFARLHQDGESLVVRMDFEQRAAMIEADPEIYYITDHYVNYEWILVRLARARADALGDLLRGAWRWAASNKGRSSKE